MSPQYLLDTNIISDPIRRPQGTIATRIAEVGESAICTSVIVAAELRYGARKSESRRLSERVELLLSAFEVLPLEQPADRHYGNLRHHLTRHGIPIGPNDQLIAAHAPASDLSLVTANEREFNRVPSLRVEIGCSICSRQFMAPGAVAPCRRAQA